MKKLLPAVLAVLLAVSTAPGVAFAGGEGFWKAAWKRLHWVFIAKDIIDYGIEKQRQDAAQRAAEIARQEEIRHQQEEWSRQQAERARCIQIQNERAQRDAECKARNSDGTLAGEFSYAGCSFAAAFLGPVPCP